MRFNLKSENANTNCETSVNAANCKFKSNHKGSQAQLKRGLLHQEPQCLAPNQNKTH